MIFEINKEVFLNKIQKVQTIVEKRNTVPILTNVKIEVKDNTMMIMATDLNVGIKDYAEVIVEDPGSITVSAKKLYEVLKELSEGTLRFQVEDNNWILITCASAEFRLVGMSDEDFPKLPKVDVDSLISVPAEIIDTLTRKTIYAVSNDDNRHVLNGVLLEVESEKIRMVATDGHRLSYIEMDNSNALPELNVIIPKKGVQEVQRMANAGGETFKFGRIEHHLVFQCEQEMVVARLVEGQFPNYSMVIPSETSIEIKIDRELFYNALRRVALFSDLKARGVKLQIENRMIFINARTPEYGEAKDELPVDYDGDPITISFNVNYLLDLLRSVGSEEILMKINNPSGPVLFEPSGELDYRYLAVVMPMVI